MFLLYREDRVNNNYGVNKMARPKQLNEVTINEIRRLYLETNCTQQQLARSFGVSQGLICKIVNNYIHKNITSFVMGGEADVRIGYKHGN